MPANRRKPCLRSKILERGNFRSGKAKAEQILDVFVSILTQAEQKRTLSKTVSGVSSHPPTWGRKGFDGDCEVR